MNTGKKALKFKAGSSARLNVGAVSRNLSKCHLGSVIFGCTNSTIKECLSNQLFGLYPQLNQYFFASFFFSFLFSFLSLTSFISTLQHYVIYFVGDHMVTYIQYLFFL